MNQPKSDQVDVKVTYAGGRGGPWQHDYDRSAQLVTVRQDVMSHFQVADSTDAAGNQIVYKLMHGADTINDLMKTVGSESGDKSSLELRLVRQVIAG